RQLGTDFSYQTRGIMLCDHGPTHIDSVSHLSRDPNAESVDKLSVLPASSKTGPAHLRENDHQPISLFSGILR
ncbi:hypothetical protein ACFLW5_01895, partial [Chloroflexota bacterium]